MRVKLTLNRIAAAELVQEALCCGQRGMRVTLQSRQVRRAQAAALPRSHNLLWPAEAMQTALTVLVLGLAEVPGSR